MKRLAPFTATLNDGTSVLIREVTQADRALLSKGFDRLSGRARYFRFLGTHNALSEVELDRFTATNTPDHVAIGALRIGGTGPDPIGIARYIRLTDQPNTAEIAITIADADQHHGLGRLLLGVLAQFAKCNGMAQFTALVHSENRAMLGLLAQLKGVQTPLGGNDIEVRFSVDRCVSSLCKSAPTQLDTSLLVWIDDGGATA